MGQSFRAVARVAYFDGKRAVFLVRRNHGKTKRDFLRGWNPWIPVPYVLIPEEFKELVESAYRDGRELFLVFALDASEIGTSDGGEYEFRASLSSEGVVYSVKGYHVGESLVDVLGIPFRIEGLSRKGWISARGKRLLFAQAEVTPQEEPEQPQGLFCTSQKTA
ncbi:hypothetical protein [Thermococcus aciditolerans]|uniref:Uncharacterized protein n=1 Tax=Thermococcus aciditolerans TaxID=2598455 RepID=A0A5C0SJV9_9EURY|nr:hypothetical protein [Thermococcus aciditolerans]QEK14036.1 hypothetical protein FPV09_01650 [Thermococcus aciditolerans]